MNKKITLDNDVQIEVIKLGIGKYKDLFADLKNLPGIVANIDSLEQNELVAKLPALISTSVDEIAAILLHFIGDHNVPFGKEQVLALGLDEFIMIVEAILEVNRVDYIIETLKKVAAARGLTTQRQIGTIGSTQ